MKARVGDQLRREAQAEFIRDKIAARLAECALELHPVKTRIVYCSVSRTREVALRREGFRARCCAGDEGLRPSASPCGGRHQTASCCVG
jgi:hypothetical protein